MNIYINGFRAANKNTVTADFADVKAYYRFYFGMDIDQVSYRGTIY